MRNKILAYLTIAATAIMPVQSLAIGKMNVNAMPNTANQQAAQTQANSQKMTNLRQRGDQEINRRITALNRLISMINAMKKISGDQKSSFVSQVNSYITELNNLKNKIDADTDLDTMKTDIQSIVSDYRVFVLFMPKITILATADKLSDISDQLTTFAGKLQTRITADQQAGKDVTSLNTELSDMQAKIADAKTQAANVENAVMTLDPSGYPGNRTGLETGRTDLQTGRTDVKNAIADAREIIQGLKTLEGTGTNTTPPSGTAAPTNQ